MGKRRRSTTGHGEGEHGPKTEARIVEQLESGPPEASAEERREHDRRLAAVEGKRRLVEGRQQHDEGRRASATAARGEPRTWSAQDYRHTTMGGLAP